MPQVKRWKGLLRRKPLRGYRNRRFANWIRDLYRRGGLGAPFKVEEMLIGCGLDPDLRQHYAAAMRFLQIQRKKFALAMLTFFVSEEYQQYINDGLSEEELFQMLVEAAVSWNVFPVWSDKDEDRNYKLYDMASYVHLKERRAGAICSEIERTSAELDFAFKKFPSLPGRYGKPKLATDGTMIALPNRVQCELCGKHYGGQSQLVNHYIGDHPGYLNRKIDEEEDPPRGLEALFG